MKQWINNFRKYLTIAILAIGVTAVINVSTSPLAKADSEVTCSDGTTVQVVNGDATASCKDHGGVKNSGSTGDPALTCNVLPQDICDAANKGGDTKSSGLFLLLKWVLNILTAVVGIAAVGTLVYAGILYSSAGDDNGMVSKAKTIIRDTVIGIVAYGLMVVLLNWIVPGGVFG